MPKVTGKAATDQYFANVPALMDKVLRGAARAGAKVIADEAKARAISEEVRDNVVTRTKAEPTRITARISVKSGWPLAVATWLEYGTDPHFITVDDSQSGGRSVSRINRLAKEGSLVINGRFVGSTVHHPGATPHPFLRPALDTKEREGIAAAQAYIDGRVRRGKIAADDLEGDVE